MPRSPTKPASKIQLDPRVVPVVVLADLSVLVLDSVSDGYRQWPLSVPFAERLVTKIENRRFCLCDSAGGTDCGTVPEARNVIAQDAAPLLGRSPG